MKKAAMVAFAIAALSGCGSMPGTDAHEGWITLIDGDRGLEEFVRVGTANWRAEDGTIVADRLADKAPGYLVTRTAYKDFVIRAEFWVSDDANSGIFIRCTAGKPVSDRTCYEANIFDRRPDPSYGTGAIVGVAKVAPMPKAGGKWNTYEITARGTRLTLVLNGETTADAQDLRLASGPVALQYGSGVVKWRKLQIRPL